MFILITGLGLGFDLGAFECLLVCCMLVSCLVCVYVSFNFWCCTWFVFGFFLLVACVELLVCVYCCGLVWVCLGDVCLVRLLV